MTNLKAKRTVYMSQLETLAQEKILIIDGAMGTEIQKT